MASLNKIILMGNLVEDPSLENKVVNGTADRPLCKFRLAVNRPYAKEGQQQADFIPCELWGQPGKFIGEHAKKGDTITVEGSLMSRSYTNKEGKNVTQYVVQGQTASIVISRSRNAQPAQGNAESAEKPADNAAAAAAAVDEFDY